MRLLLLLPLLLNCALLTAADEPKTPAVKLEKRKWTTLVLIRNANHPTTEIPDDAPVQNFPKDYSFSGPGGDRNHLGAFKIDGRYLLKEGYLRRDFGEHALLQLPAADGFELEGVVHLNKEGGLLILVGWDVSERSGYAIYNVHLRTSGSHWFAVEIKHGEAVPGTQQPIVQKGVEGETALRIQMEEKKLTLELGKGYVCKDYNLPNYASGVVAIGTFPIQYGPKDISIKSLRMRLK